MIKTALRAVDLTYIDQTKLLSKLVDFAADVQLQPYPLVLRAAHDDEKKYITDIVAK